MGFVSCHTLLASMTSPLPSSLNLGIKELRAFQEEFAQQCPKQPEFLHCSLPVSFPPAPTSLTIIINVCGKID